MNKHFVGLSLLLLLSGCIPEPIATPFPGSAVTQAPTFAIPIVSTETSPILPTPTTNSIPSLSATTAISLPDGLVVAYIVEDSLWIWKQSSARLLVEQKDIFDPRFSEDGQWIVFQQEYISPVDINHFEEVWVIRTDSSELHRLLGPDDLNSLVGEEKAFLIDNISWLPDRHELLFNTEEIIEGPPGSNPVFDLNLLDLLGQITRLVDPGQGGNFIPSPMGKHVALVTGSSIGILDLENGEQHTLFEFEPLQFPSDGGLPTPEAVWDSQGQYIMTSIPPQKLYYPEFAGEPEQIWRLFVDGQVELVAQFQPSPRTSGIVVSPNLQHYLYQKSSCPDAMGMLYVHDLASGEEQSLFCVWNLPQWTPDDEHFVYWLDGMWQLGDISDASSRPLDFLNIPTNPAVHASPQLTWMDDKYFLLTLRGSEACTLSIATLEEIVTEIVHTPPDSCPDADFSLSK